MKKKIIKIGSIFVAVLFLYIGSSHAITPKSELKYTGIDISNWQGYIDYTRVKNDGIQIVYMKSSEGRTFKDPYFEYNYRNAKANGLKVGFYHFVRATTVERAYQEAEFFSSVISGKNPDCKLVMDYEVFNGLNREQVNQIALAFLERTKQLTGKDVIVYSNLWDARNIFNTKLANQYQLWLAYWGNYVGLENYATSWQNYIGVQYTSNGYVNGINGRVDRDLFTKDIFLSGASPDPNPTPIPENNQTTIYYKVVWGDTLWALSRRYNTTIEEIARLNNIKNVDLIYAGQTLRIVTNSNNQSNSQTTIGSGLYVVKRGDCLWNIARRYGTTVNNLVALNGIRNRNLIYPGQILRLY